MTQPAPGTAWFVIFPRSTGPAPAWWQRGLAPGYRHCLAARADGATRSLVVEHFGAAMLVHSVALPIGALVRDLQQALVAQVLMVVRPDTEAPPRLRLPMTCTETVKAVLGLLAPWIVTPWQLARHLRRRHGARVVLPNSQFVPA